MPAIGAHIPRADRPRIHSHNPDGTLRPDVLVRQIRVAVADGTTLTLQELGARQIRARAAAAREAIAEQAEATEAIRTARRWSAHLRRAAQRKARIYTGTDRATIRARRAVIATPARPGRITALNRFFGR